MRGRELAEKIRADADKQRTIILANATKESEKLEEKVMPLQLQHMPKPLIKIQNSMILQGA